MRAPRKSKKAGVALTTTGPLNTDALTPDATDSSNEDLSPEESSSAVVPIDGADLLNRILAFYSRFAILPFEAAAHAVVAWVAHTHLMEAWDSTPRLAFLSPEPGSGKSRAMEIAALFSPRAIEAANATTAALIRAVSDPDGTPTFFIDEIDTIYGQNGKGDELLRGFINAGHRRGGGVLRCEASNDDWAPTLRSSYAAIAMAGIGNLPDTILTRSVIIRMRKRAPDENVEPYRHRDHAHIGHALRDELAQWAQQVAAKAGTLRPALPSAVVDRNADVWESLIVIGDLAGGAWPQRVRDVAVQFVVMAKKQTQPSLGVQLLADIRACFGNKDRLSSADLVTLLLQDPEANWGDLQGRKLDQLKLAKMLAQYDIKPDSIRTSGQSTPRGYRVEWFYDAWKRYLPVLISPATSATPATVNGDPQQPLDLDGEMLRQKVEDVRPSADPQC